jgi:hypothetical protein
MLILPIQNHMQKRARGSSGDARTGKVPSSNAALMTGFFLEWSKNALKSA